MNDSAEVIESPVLALLRGRPHHSANVGCSDLRFTNPVPDLGADVLRRLLSASRERLTIPISAARTAAFPPVSARRGCLGGGGFSTSDAYELCQPLWSGK
jgi:hypothetical protein